jgi:geranylgeranyl diphosphate synthase type II
MPLASTPIASRAASLKEYLVSRSQMADKALERYLPSKSQPPSLIHEAMRYSIFAGGKRLRPILVMAAAETCGGKPSWVMPTACAVEMIHTYSLIHDDLPAMDNDDLRRGRPTSHKVYGEGMAILAGDALLTQAFEVMGMNAAVAPVRSENVVRAIQAVARGAGSQGMVGGQVVDTQMDKGRWLAFVDGDKSKSGKTIRYIHEHKTASLIIACLEAGAILANGTPKQVKALARYGLGIGLAFQVRDDVLDIIGDKKKLGKSGSDADNKKMTYPAIFGIDESLKTADRLVRDAKDSVAVFGAKGKILSDLADYILNRES